MNTLDERLVEVIPSDRQVKLQQMEFYAFVHFTVNTFTDREWGDGTEDPAIFNPTLLDANQWVRAICDAGMTGLILTCKHHDGFCLWPSAYTEHSVRNSPYKNGKGDVVAEVAAACHRAGIGFGVYLSPWDRNQPLYGTGKAYDDYFVNQLTELLTNYGPVFSVWFDGACGEGPNGRKQYYDWPRYYETIRRLQPQACIHVCGPDIRWCGNEAGNTRPSEWSVVPARTRDTEKIASTSQQSDQTAFRERPIKAKDMDLGSRKLLHDEPELVWYPAEVNTSIRPGWFWHAAEDDQVKPLERLIHIYEHSVGGNATMLLNIPPTSEGLFHPNDVARLHEIGEYLRTNYAEDLALRARITAAPAYPEHPCEAVLKQDDAFYMPLQKEDCHIELQLPELQRIGRVVLQENIRMSQRVERFVIEARTADGWVEVYDGTVIGYKKIAVLEPVMTDAVRIRILDSRMQPTLRFVGIYA